MRLKTESDQVANENLQSIGIFLVEDFSSDSLSIILEALECANRIAAEPIYDIELYSSHGGTLKSSLGLSLDTLTLTSAGNLDCLIIGDSSKIRYFDHGASFRCLRRHLSKGTQLGCIGSAVLLLAKAGLLDGHAVVVNARDLVSFKSLYSELSYSLKMYRFEGQYMSCAGGISALDMILSWIARQQSQALKMAISEYLNHLPIDENQNQLYFQKSANNIDAPGLSRALELMHKHIESPLSLSNVADQSFMSLRQMQRLFQNHLKTTPGKYYQQFRLKLARQLLLSSNRKIIDICLATGFESPSHFSSCFKEFFGHPPGLQRKTSKPLNAEIQIFDPLTA